MDESDEVKENFWLNVSNHYTSNHEACLSHGEAWASANKDGGKELLDLFLLKTLNESFHALKAKFASKDLLCLDSWFERVSTAILQYK